MGQLLSRRRNRCWLIGIALSISFLSAVAFVAAPAVAAPTAPQSASPSSQLKTDNEDPTVQADAANWYASYYNVSLSAAYERLQIQDDAQAVIDQVKTSLGSQWAGSWFDANDQGRVKIGVATTQNPPTGASVDNAKAILATTGVDQYTDFVDETSSMTQLESAQKTIDSHLSSVESANEATTDVSPADNAVVIKTANNITSDGMAQVNAITAPVSVQIKKTNYSLKMTPDSCIIKHGAASYNELYCDPPLRGGPVIANNSTAGTGWCTGGFVVKSNSDSKPYLLTAGHCLAQEFSNEWDTRETDNTVHKIGEGHSYEWDAGGDFGLISVDEPGSDHWDVGSTSYVWVGSSSGGGTTQNSFYPITNRGTTSQYMTVCASSGVGFSTGYNTDCGEVLAIGQSNGVTTHLADTNLCGIEGASGGPVYKNNTGYGLIVSGATDHCQTQYQGLVGAEDALNVGLL